MKTSVFLRAFLVFALVCSIAGLPHADASSAKPARPEVVISTISLDVEGGGGGRLEGGSSVWTFRSNGTAERRLQLSPVEMDSEVGQNPPHSTGTFSSYEFTQLLKYLQYSKLLDLKAPPPDATGMEGFTSVTLVRNGKSKSILVPESASESAATVGLWVMQKLVSGIAADIDWRNDAGLSVNTGLGGVLNFDKAMSPEDLTLVSSASIFDVRDGMDRIVGKIRRSNVDDTFRLVLPPGSYHLTLTLKGQPVPEGVAASPVKNYIWRATPSPVVVSAGQISSMNIQWEKTAAP